eukprot:s2097_g2.t1
MEAWGDVFSQLASSCRIAVDLLTGNLSCCEATTVIEEEVTVSLKNRDDQNEEETAERAALGPNAVLCTQRKATDPTRMMLTPSTVCSDEEKEEAEAVMFKSQGAPGLNDLPPELTRNVAGFLHVTACLSLRGVSRDESWKKALGDDVDEKRLNWEALNPEHGAAVYKRNFSLAGSMYTFKMKGYILHGWPEFELSKAAETVERRTLPLLRQRLLHRRCRLKMIQGSAGFYGSAPETYISTVSHFKPSAQLGVCLVLLAMAAILARRPAVTAGCVGVAAGTLGTWFEMSHGVFCIPVLTLPPMALSHQEFAELRKNDGI